MPPVSNGRELRPTGTSKERLTVICVSGHQAIIPISWGKIWENREKEQTETLILRAVQTRFDSEIFDGLTIYIKAEETLVIFIDLCLEDFHLCFIAHYHS